MSLLTRIILRLIGVALLCLAAACIWILHDITARLHFEAQTSAERVAKRWEMRPGLSSINPPSSAFLWIPDDEITVTPVLPGVCVELNSTYDGITRRCSGWDGLGDSAPSWFSTTFAKLFDVATPVVRTVVFRGRTLGSVSAAPNLNAATERAWRQVRILLGVAAAMGLAMCVLAAIVTGHALLPVQTIIRGLKGLGDGSAATRLPAFSTAEFDRIARAVNDLAERLRITTAERTELTRRLFNAQEEERRALARELHDEFGQCLAAVSALASSIEMAERERHADTAEDARTISRMTAQMRQTLREALARLRVPDLDEIGLEACLRTVVAAWNSHRGNSTHFALELSGDLSSVPAEEALNVFRIVQECLTNAARHGQPSRVVVRVQRDASSGGSVVLMVEDNGGGDPEQLSKASGYGILGIRERIGLLGGSLAIGRSEGGISVQALIPVNAAGAA